MKHVVKLQKRVHADPEGEYTYLQKEIVLPIEPRERMWVVGLNFVEWCTVITWHMTDFCFYVKTVSSDFKDDLDGYTEYLNQLKNIGWKEINKKDFY